MNFNPYIHPIKGDISRADAVCLYLEANKCKTVFEYGIGGSTIFLAGSNAEVYAFEDQQTWIDRVEENLNKFNQKASVIKTDYNEKDLEDYYNKHLPELIFIDCNSEKREQVLTTLFEIASPGG